MNFEQATAYLTSLKPAGIQMGLERMHTACEALSHPERAYPAVHIAGTNGKGSTARMIAAMLTANGYRTGLYTSPMITDITDMILIDGVPVTPKEFAACVTAVRHAVPEGLSEYECLTSAVFVCFQRQKVDIAVIECCMGGETDATNIIPPPLCAVFTPIAKDHTAFLGDTVEEIASCKGGIIKDGCDVICAASMDEDALGVLFEKAAQHGATVHIPVAGETAEIGINGTRFHHNNREVRLRLAGHHQHENALTALQTMTCLQRRGFRFDEERALAALSAVTMPCRQEIVCESPFVMLDGAHNPHGIEAFCRTLEEMPLDTLVIGMLADKDCDSCLKRLAPYFRRIICCTPPDTPRALPARELAATALQYHANVSVISDPVKAFTDAKKTSASIVVGGSFYTSSVVRKAIISE